MHLLFLVQLQSPEVLKFFMALGVPIFEAYGMTENCAYVTSNDFESIEIGSVGRPHENCEIKMLMMEKYLHDTAELLKDILKMKKAQEKLLMKKDGFILVT